jgi:hypothetical protein
MICLFTPSGPRPRWKRAVRLRHAGLRPAPVGLRPPLLLVFVSHLFLLRLDEAPTLELPLRYPIIRAAVSTDRGVLTRGSQTSEIPRGPTADCSR